MRIPPAMLEQPDRNRLLNGPLLAPQIIVHVNRAKTRAQVGGKDLGTLGPSGSGSAKRNCGGPGRISSRRGAREHAMNSSNFAAIKLHAITKVSEGRAGDLGPMWGRRNHRTNLRGGGARSSRGDAAANRLPGTGSGPWETDLRSAPHGFPSSI